LDWAWLALLRPSGPLAEGAFYGLGTSFSIASISFTSTNSDINVNSANYSNVNSPPQVDLTNQYLVNSYPPSGPMTLTIAVPSAVTAFALKFTRPQPPL
jgi:hypothetical protein